MRFPWLKFYVVDWLNHPGLRSSSRSARGLAIDLLCLMHQGEPYGHLRVGRKDLSEVELARIVGGVEAEIGAELQELLDAGVFARTTVGRIYSPRMVRDEEQRVRSKEHGARGGNPLLLGQVKPTDYRRGKQGDNPSHARARSEVRGQKSEDLAASQSRRKRKESSEQGLQHAEAIGLWKKFYEAAIGRPYVFDGSADGKQIKRLMGFPDFTLEELERRATQFLQAPYWAKVGVDLKKFVSQWTAQGNAGRHVEPGPKENGQPSEEEREWIRRALRDPDAIVQEEARKLLQRLGMSEAELLGGQA